MPPQGTPPNPIPFQPLAETPKPVMEASVPQTPEQMPGITPEVTPVVQTPEAQPQPATSEVVVPMAPSPETPVGQPQLEVAPNNLGNNVNELEKVEESIVNQAGPIIAKETNMLLREEHPEPADLADDVGTRRMETQGSLEDRHE